MKNKVVPASTLEESIGIEKQPGVWKNLIVVLTLGARFGLEYALKEDVPKKSTGVKDKPTHPIYEKGQKPLGT